jgi:3-deoxy-manno-octulosonate cytidylyltransferase (CMP-KDO synthetase)
MKIVGIIPARYESSRFPGKPLALICGKPMIYWVYTQVKKVNGLDNVIVATDSAEIEKVCKQFGMEVIMTSSEHPTGTDRLGEVAKKIDADFYINIQGDEPLIEPETIETVITYLKVHPNTQIVNTKTLLRDDDDVTSNTIVKVVSADNGDGLYLSRAAIPYPKRGQQISYYKHLGLYGLTKEALLYFSNTERGTIEKIEDIEMMRFLENGYRIKFVTVESHTIGVDRPEDIQKVEAAMKMKGIGK